MWFYYLVLLLILLLYLSTLASRYKKLFYYFSGLVLVLVAGLRGPGIDADMITYYDYYRLLPHLSLIQVEPTFQLIGYAVKLLFNNIIFLFIIYAILGVGIKLLAIERLSQLYLLSLLMYFSYYFLLHEMTQIRVGVASAFLLLSIPDIYNRNLKGYGLKMLAGCLFHYSLLFFIPFYLLAPRKINLPFYFFVIICGYLAYFSGIHLVNLFKLIPIAFISSKISTYQMLLAQHIHAAIDIFNVVFLFRVCLCLLFLFKWKVLFKQNEYSIVLIKIYSFSIFFFVALADLPVLAARVNQLLAIVEIILIPFIVYLFKPKIYAILAVVLIACGLLSLKLLYGELVNPYLKLF